MQLRLRSLFSNDWRPYCSDSPTELCTHFRSQGISPIATPGLLNLQSQAMMGGAGGLGWAGGSGGTFQAPILPADRQQQMMAQLRLQQLQMQLGGLPQSPFPPFYGATPPSSGCYPFSPIPVLAGIPLHPLGRTPQCGLVGRLTECLVHQFRNMKFRKRAWILDPQDVEHGVCRVVRFLVALRQCAFDLWKLCVSAGAHLERSAINSR